VCYPRTQEGHHRLGPDGKPLPSAADDALLADSLIGHQLELKRQISTWLKDGETLRTMSRGFHLSLSMEQVESLLQALNDIRVASWVELGRPDSAVSATETLDEHTTPHLLAMEVTGHFQMVLIASLEAPNSD
ncbi:MAG TPA: hypothetical protein VK968_07625, partial [Roseimicrobium sp.]|nr:hypothetical protein [Roseimicrobium sp.]